MIIPNFFTFVACIPGIYSDSTHKNVEIAVKITMDQNSYDREMRIYETFNATTDTTIEQHGIPRIYYSGAFLRKYRVIAMTLFDGTLLDLYEKKGNISPDFSILLILKQTVCAIRLTSQNCIVKSI